MLNQIVFLTLPTLNVVTVSMYSLATMLIIGLFAAERG